VENLRLFVFKNKSEGSESPEKPPVGLGEKGEVVICPL
jgi:hypothetical protein